MKKELAIIRDKVNTLLDALNVQPKGTENTSATAAPVTTSQPTQLVGMVTASRPDGKFHIHSPFDRGESTQETQGDRQMVFVEAIDDIIST